MIRYHAAWVVPVSAAPIRNGTVVVHDGRIVYAGPRDAAPPGADDDLGDAAGVPQIDERHPAMVSTPAHPAG